MGWWKCSVLRMWFKVYVFIRLSKFIDFYPWKWVLLLCINYALIKSIFKKRHFGGEDVSPMLKKKSWLFHCRGSWEVELFSERYKRSCGRGSPGNIRSPDGKYGLSWVLCPYVLPAFYLPNMRRAYWFPAAKLSLAPFSQRNKWSNTRTLKSKHLPL